MRLIIEKIDDSVYAYRETEKSFKVNEPQRTSEQLNPISLDWECDLTEYDDFHMVFRVKKGAQDG